MADPSTLLAAAQAFVAEATSFRFSYTIDDPTAFSLEPPRVPPRGVGEWTDQRWHLVKSDAHTRTRTERIVDGDTAYERSDGDGQQYSEARWKRRKQVPFPRADFLENLELTRHADLRSLEFYVPGLGYSLEVLTAATVYVGDIDGTMTSSDEVATGYSGNPHGFLDAIGRISDAVVSRHEGDTFTLAATLRPPRDFAAAYGSKLPPGRLELDVDADGRPRSMRLRLARGWWLKVRIHVEFWDWNGAVDIALPSSDDVDRFPEVNEHAMRDAVAAGLTLYAPTSLSEEWTLSQMIRVPAMAVMDAWDNPSLRDCPAVELVWLRRRGSRLNGRLLAGLNLVELTVDCAQRSDPTSFEPGGLAGLPHRRGYSGSELLVGNTVITIKTSMGGSELADVLSSLQPADLEALMVRVTGP